MFNFKSWFQPESQKIDPVKETDTTGQPFDLSPSKLQQIMQRFIPSKWDRTRMFSCGPDKSAFVGGNHYPPNYTSERRRLRRLEQIKKGIITVTEEKEDGKRSD